MLKKKWKKPKLFILFRKDSAGSCLVGCKMFGQGNTPGPANYYSDCRWEWTGSRCETWDCARSYNGDRVINNLYSDGNTFGHKMIAGKNSEFLTPRGRTRNKRDCDHKKRIYRRLSIFPKHRDTLPFAWCTPAHTVVRATRICLFSFGKI